MGILINGINNNNVYLNKFGDDTFLSSIQKKNEEALKQEQILNTTDEKNSNDNEITEKVKEEEIARRIAKGQGVTAAELKYIKSHNGELLDKAKAAKNMKNNIRNEIKSAESRDEVIQIKNRASLNALASIASGKISEESSIDFSMKNEVVSEVNKEISTSKIDKLIY